MVKSMSEAGYATVMVLGMALVIATLITASALWVRFAAFSTQGFIVDLDARHTARMGVAQAISLLLADSDPEIDWLGEDWALGWQGEGVTVTLTDEGSRLGVNWLDLPLLETLLASHTAVAEDVYQALGQRAVLISDTEALMQVHPNLESIANFISYYSLLNINSMDSQALERLWRAAGADPLQAASITRQILVRRESKPFTSIEELHTLSALSSARIATVSTWICVDGPININTASQDTLAILLRTAGFDPSLATSVLQARAQNPFADWHGVAAVLDKDTEELQAIQRWLTFTSHVFRIHSSHVAAGIIIEAIVRRVWHEDTKQWNIQILAWTERVEHE